MTNILHVSASVNGTQSNSRRLASELIGRIVAQSASANVIERDTNDATISALTGEVVGAFYTPADARTDAQRDVIAVSEKMVREVKNADVLVIGAPMYNFGIPSTLKAWVDLIARVGVTFRYTENGPLGLLEGKKAYLVVATGGVPVNSPADFVTPYLKQVLGFIGITDVDVIEASGFGVDAKQAMDAGLANVQSVDLPNAA
ncbi:NAD(P)H-dependent oxidoreductase [Thalassospira sp. MA62]|nr:NAD(P)H-dependent oxidoreductase [Thalassospira sp. MA62]